MKRFLYICMAILLLILLLTGTGMTFLSQADSNDAEPYEEDYNGNDEGFFSEDQYLEQFDDIEDYEEPIISFARAKVIRIEEVAYEDQYAEHASFTSVQLLEIRITSGKFKNNYVRVENYIEGHNEAFNIRVSEGSGVLLYIEENEDGTIQNAYVSEILRDKYLLWLAIVFVLVLVAVGRLKGIKAVITLALTFVAVLRILLPAILRGHNPILISVLICIAITIVTLTIISGFNKKTFSAIIGTVGGFIIAGAIALIVGFSAKLTGFGTEESRMLLFIPQDIDFNYQGILFAGIIIGAMGAIMDVGMSVSSSMHEIKEANPQIKTKDLIKAGMNVGRDVMSTMSNTLILAYTGGAIHLLLIIMAYDITFTEIINTDLVASEVLRALAGSIGLICAVPITALVAGSIEKKRIVRKKRPMVY